MDTSVLVHEKSEYASITASYRFKGVARRWGSCNRFDERGEPRCSWLLESDNGSRSESGHSLSIDYLLHSFSIDCLSKNVEKLTTTYNCNETMCKGHFLHR